MIKIYLVFAGIFGLAGVVHAEGDDAKKKAKYHCEKTIDGKTKDLADVKSRKECKKNGGKWKKAHKKGDDKHKDGDGHDHG